jgi:hypothetical protein
MAERGKLKPYPRADSRATSCSPTWSSRSRQVGRSRKLSLATRKRGRDNLATSRSKINSEQQVFSRGTLRAQPRELGGGRRFSRTSTRYLQSITRRHRILSGPISRC